MTLAELLQWVSLGQKTGTLTIAAGGIEKRILISEGRVLSSSSTDPREYLGHFLVAHGYITEEELRKGMQVQEESGILLGKILVMIGAIAESDLTRLMRLKLAESIYDVFLWQDGDFRFVDGDLPEQKMVPLSVDVTGMVMEGLRRIDEWRRIREQISGSNVIPRLLREPDTTDLTEQEQHMLPFIDGRRSIADVALQSHASEFHVSKLVYDLLRLETVAIEAPAPAPAAAESEEPAENQVVVLMRGAREARDRGDAIAAWHWVRSALEVDPQDKDAKEMLRDTEKAVIARLESEGLVTNRVPSLKASVRDITQRDFSPNEGFILSRINGTWDVKSILKISPIREIDALLIFKKLVDEDVIQLA